MSDKKHYVNYRDLHANLAKTIPYTQCSVFAIPNSARLHYGARFRVTDSE
jgi:hypothetical protein